MDALGTFTLFSALAVGAAMPVYVLVRSAVNLARLKSGRGLVVLKAVASLAAWLFLSFCLFNLLFVTVFSAAHAEDREAAALGSLALLVVICLAYIALLGGLAVLVWHRAEE